VFVAPSAGSPMWSTRARSSSASTSTEPRGSARRLGGANATVVCGHTIGEYAFVGAGAVVTKDVGRLSLVTGVPARQWLDVPLRGAPVRRERRCPAVQACGQRYRETSAAGRKSLQPETPGQVR